MGDDFKPGNTDRGRFGTKSKLSAAVLSLVAAFGVYHATDDQRKVDDATIAILDQFILEREGSKTHAYLDGASTTHKRIWTICKGLTEIDGRPVTENMVLPAAECQAHDRKALMATYEELKKIVKPDVLKTLGPAPRAGITSFCTYNIGSPKCRGSTFLLDLNQGRRNEACAQITLWIRDQGRDCRVRANGCAGQVDRRQQEDELCMTGA